MVASADGLRLNATVATAAPAQPLSTLPFDFDRYVQVEPRLRSARWLSGEVPRLGAQAEVVADIPYSILLVRAVMGDPRVTATITEWQPPSRIGVAFEARRFTGRAVLDLRDLEGGSEVTVTGMVRANSRFGRLALRPITPQLERLATRAIERGVSRAAAAIAASNTSVDQESSPDG